VAGCEVVAGAVVAGAASGCVSIVVDEGDGCTVAVDVVAAVVVAVAVVVAAVVDGGGGAVVAAGGLATVKSPFMTAECGSHWKWYEPGWRSTVHVVEPTKSTVVERSTPGPVRWKSWLADWSVTSIVYVPGVSSVTGDPPLVSEMVNPGPTLADSGSPAPRPGPESSAAATSPSAKTGIASTRLIQIATERNEDRIATARDSTGHRPDPVREITPAAPTASSSPTHRPRGTSLAPSLVTRCYLERAASTRATSGASTARRNVRRYA
jgi:hypothetical protein